MRDQRLTHNSAAPPLPPPLPPPLLRSSVPHRSNRLQSGSKNNSPTTSMGSNTESSSSDLVLSSHSIEQRRLIPDGTSSRIPVTKAVPAASPSSQKTTASSRRRTPPPVPNDAGNLFRHNTDNEFAEGRSDYRGHPRDSKAFQAYTKPMGVRNDRRVSSSAQTDDYDFPKVTANDQGRRVERTPPHISFNQFQRDERDSIGLEIIDPPVTNARRQGTENHGDQGFRSERVRRAPTIIEDYEIEDRDAESIQQPDEELPPIRYNSSSHPPPPRAFVQPYLRKEHRTRSSIQDNSSAPDRKRTLPPSGLMMETGALLVVCILCMVLVLAIRENAHSLRTTVQCVYSYIYIASIIWMLWCMFDIIKFRRQWLEITESALNHEDYMDISERHSHTMFYFPDIHNTGGLFMRIGAGLLCMGGLILTVIELAKTIATINNDQYIRAAGQNANPPSVTITKVVFLILRFLFHCVQFSFLFRYGNLIINRYHQLARIGLIHLVIANFCTWFDAIVIETLEQIHKIPVELLTTTPLPDFITSAFTATSVTDDSSSNNSVLYVMRETSHTSSDSTNSNVSALALLKDIEEKMGPYLYPCLIEYSLISLTVFFIMWRNVGNMDKRSFLRFGARHIFTVNCARASRGLLIGGIIFLLTIITLVPTYMLETTAAIIATHLTELVLLAVSLLTVCAGYIHTTKLYYDHHAHVDAFDQALILMTTVGDFAYSFFGLLAALLIDRDKVTIPLGVEVAIGFLAIMQTFAQTSFILDTLKRRVKTKEEIRRKPGRETVTALLLMNLAIWMHDSLSAKKVRWNPLQNRYYDQGTWAIIQAFTSPLSIFYRFHSSVCLADIWQEVFQVDEKANQYRPTNHQGEQDNKH